MTETMTRDLEEVDATGKAFEFALAGFLAAAQKKVDERYAQYAPLQSARLSATINKKSVRVVITSQYTNDGITKDGQSSAFCFVEIATGNVFKAAGWAGPEKRNPRSNIYADDFGVSGVNGYGAIYLR